MLSSTTFTWIRILEWKKTFEYQNASILDFIKMLKQNEGRGGIIKENMKNISKISNDHIGRRQSFHAN